METLIGVAGAIYSHPEILVEACFALIALASVVTAVTPTPRDDIFLGKLYKFVEALALNIGHAKEAPPNRKPAP